MALSGMVMVCVDRAGQTIGDDLLDLLAVGHYVDAALDGVGHLRAAGLDGQREMADLFGTDAELDRRDLVGFQVERARQAESVHQLEPRFGLQVEFDRLRIFEVVVNGHREGDLVVLGQGDGQVEIDEEVLEDAERFGRAAEQAVRATRPRRSIARW